MHIMVSRLASSRRTIKTVMRRCLEKSRTLAIYHRSKAVVVGKVQTQPAKEQSAEQAEHVVSLKDNLSKEAEALSQWTRAGEQPKFTCFTGTKVQIRTERPSPVGLVQTARLSEGEEDEGGGG
jgi:hypothetical protein